MQAQTEVRTIQRIARIPRSAVSGRTAKPLQNGNTTPTGTTTQGFSISDVNILPILARPIMGREAEIDSNELARLMVGATQEFTGSLEQWQFSHSDTLDDLILRCADRLKVRKGIDHIEILTKDGNLRLVLKKYIGSRGTVYCIPLRPIMPLRWKNPTLFHILFSFVKSLPYLDLFNTGEYRIDSIWDYLFEEEVYHKENGSVHGNTDSVRFFERYRDFYDNYEAKDYKKLLLEYRPRKPLHCKIKQLLLKADTIDFQVPFRIVTKDPYAGFFDHWESFLVVDDGDSEFTTAYIDMLNECANESDIVSAYEHAMVEKGSIRPFEDGLTFRLNGLDDFLSELIELINQL